MLATQINIRPANKADRNNINRVIEAAVMTWNLPERVKRLSLSTYYYTAIDFEHLELFVVEDDQQNIVGVAAWEQADVKDTPTGKTALLLHGIYVQPTNQHSGIGRQLFKAAEVAADKSGFDGLLVKAQEDASGFFISQDMKKLQIVDPMRDYANRFWKNINH